MQLRDLCLDGLQSPNQWSHLRLLCLLRFSAFSANIVTKNTTIIKMVEESPNPDSDLPIHCFNTQSIADIDFSRPLRGWNAGISKFESTQAEQIPVYFMHDTSSSSITSTRGSVPDSTGMRGTVADIIFASAPSVKQINVGTTPLSLSTIVLIMQLSGRVRQKLLQLHITATLHIILTV